MNIMPAGIHDDTLLPTWRQLLVVAAGNTLIAVLLWAVGAQWPFFGVWVTSECLGLAVCFCYSAAAYFLRPRFGLLPAIVVGIGVGLPAGVLLARLIGFDAAYHELFSNWAAAARYALLVLIFTLAFSYFFHSRLRIVALEQARQEAELREATGQKAALQAELRLLQAQIEPHFLFNTLANLHSLIGRDDAGARRLLETLNDYLRTSLAHSRAARATLGDECDMLTAYLAIQAQRMGGRLQTRIEVDDALRGTPFPPMLLQPLVENAILHGIEPKLGTGQVSVTAARVGEWLHVAVRDDGVGLGAGPHAGGSGIGLANVRERLRALYGEHARFELKENRPAGVIAELWIPIETAPAP